MFLCVFASSWQAPVPWLHYHGENSGCIDGAQLALHLQTLHANSDESESGWHFHFVMLDDIVRGSGLPIPAQEGDAPVLPKEHAVLADHFQSSVTSLSGPVLLAFTVDLSSVQPTGLNERDLFPMHFLEDLTSSCRLHLVLCIARC